MRVKPAVYRKFGPEKKLFLITQLQIKIKPCKPICVTGLSSKTRKLLFSKNGIQPCHQKSGKNNICIKQGSLPVSIIVISINCWNVVERKNKLFFDCSAEFLEIFTLDTNGNWKCNRSRMKLQHVPLSLWQKTIAERCAIYV